MNDTGLNLRTIAPDEAARRLAGCERLDPRGIATAADLVAMCQAGQCFALDGAADAVYVLRVVNGMVWVDAARGSGPVDLTAAIDQLVSTQAAGLRGIALQTRRRGLVAKLQRRGYHVAGWIMKKEGVQRVPA